MLTVKDGKGHNWAKMPLAEMAHGNAMDSYYTYKLFHLFQEELKKIDLWDHYVNLLSPLIPVLADIERQGMLIDTEALESLGQRVKTKVDESKSRVESYPFIKDYKITSNPDLIQIFYTDKDGLNLYPPTKTDKGSPSVDKDAIETLENLIEAELESRK